MTILEMFQRTDEIYRRAEREDRELTDAELQELDGYGEAIFGTLDD